VAGRVVLTDLAGADDMSRVRVDLGRGEGGATPDGSGYFEFSDVEPDVYNLVVTYAGGLTADARGSAYQRYETRVVARAGGSISLGDIRPELALADVTGELRLPDDTLMESDAVVSLDDGKGRVLTSNTTGGAYAFSSVPVGYYALTVTGEGAAVPAARVSAPGGPCATPVTVGEEDVPVTVASPEFAPTQVSVLAGAGEVVREDGLTWYLSGDNVNARFISEYAARGRWWMDDGEPTAWTPFQPDGYSLTHIAEGETVARFQFRDACTYQSDVIALRLVRDVTPPRVTRLTLNDGRPFTTSPTVRLSLEAADALSPSLEMKLALCNGPCDASALSAVPWVPLENDRTVTFDATPGTKTAALLARDLSGLQTPEVAMATVTLDADPPADPSVTIEGGAEVTRSRLVQVTLSATGASQAQVGTTSGLASTPWQPYAPTLQIALPGGTTPQFVYARFRDDAGNTTAEVHDSITLDDVPPRAPVITAPRANAHVATHRPTIQWTDEATSGATRYTVQVVRLADRAAQEWESTSAATTPTADLADGEYVVSVVAHDAAGNQSLRSSSAFTVDGAPPTTLSGLEWPRATRSLSPLMTWRVGTDNTGIAHYEVEIATDEGMASLAQGAHVLGTSYLPQPLAEGGYHWRVRAVDLAGTPGPWATAEPPTPGGFAMVVDVTPPTSPRLAPLLFSVVDLPGERLDVTLAVRATDAHPFHYEIRGGVGLDAFTDPREVSQWDDARDAPFFRLPADQESYLRIRAVDDAGNVSDEDFLRVVEDSTPPEPPVLVGVVDGNRRVRVRWAPSPSSDVAGYRVLYGVTSGRWNGSFVAEGASPVDVGSATETVLHDVPNGFPFFVTVAAYDRTEEGGPHVSTPATPLAALANPVTPALLARHALPNDVADLLLLGCVLYVVDRTAGLRVLDVSDPGHPVEVGAPLRPGIATSYGPAKVRRDGSLLYVLYLYNGRPAIHALDVSTPRTPVGLSTCGPAAPCDLSPYGATDFVAHRGHLYLASSVAGVVTVSYQDPAAPVVLGATAFPGQATLVGLNGTSLLVYDQGCGGVRSMGLLPGPVPGPASGCAANAGIMSIGPPLRDTDGGVRGLLLAGGERGVVLSDGRAVTGTPGTARSIALLGPVAYVADAEGGVQVVHVRAEQSFAGPLELTAEPLGAIKTDHPAVALAVDGTMLYVAAGNAVTVHEIATPTGPRVASQSVPAGGAATVSVDEQVVRTTPLTQQDGNALLVPRAMREVTSHVDAQPQSVSLVAVNNRLYVDRMGGPSLVYDVTTPTFPRLVSRYPSLTLALGSSEPRPHVTNDRMFAFRPGFEDAAVSVADTTTGDHFAPVAPPRTIGLGSGCARTKSFAATGHFGIAVGIRDNSLCFTTVDASDPEHPLEAGALLVNAFGVTENDEVHLAATNSRLFVVVNCGPLFVMDVSGLHRTPPVPATRMYPSDSVGLPQVAHGETLLWIADGTSAYLVTRSTFSSVDASLGLSPVVSVQDAPWTSPGIPGSGFAHDGKLYWATQGAPAIMEVDPSRVEDAHVLYRHPAEGELTALVGANGHAYWGQFMDHLGEAGDQRFSGIAFVPLAAPSTTPTYLTTPAAQVAVATHDDVLFRLGSWGELSAEPRLWASVTHDVLPLPLDRQAVPAAHLAVAGTRAYVAAGTNGLFIVDIADPSRLAVVHHGLVGERVVGVAPDGDTLYVVLGPPQGQPGSVVILDLSQPATPVEVATVSVPGDPVRLVPRGAYLYVAAGRTGTGSALHVLDAGTGSTAAVLPLDGAPHDVVVSGRFAYLPCGDQGLQVVDVTDPANPFLSAVVDTPGYATGVALLGPVAVVADGEGGVQVVDLEP
jgi:hypothetical protein